MSAQSKPLVSIVMPTYNGSEYIDQAIRSCLDQTYPNLELIVVDDASTDETPEILTRFASSVPNMRVIRHEENRRLPGALNTGFAHSKGEFLTWTSDDNLFAPEAIARMVEYLEGRPPEVGAVCGDMWNIGPNGEILRRKEVDPTILPERNGVNACFLYRRSVYETTGEYAIDMFLVEDTEFWIRVIKNFVIEKLPEPQPLYYYRVHPKSLTATREVDMRLLRARMLCKHVYPRRMHGLVKAKAYRKIFQIYKENNNYEMFILFFIKCFASSPSYALKYFMQSPRKLDRLLGACAGIAGLLGRRFGRGRQAG